MIITYKNIKKFYTYFWKKIINLELKLLDKKSVELLKGINNLKSLKNKIKSKKYLISTLNLTENLLIKNEIRKSQLIEKNLFKNLYPFLR